MSVQSRFWTSIVHDFALCPNTDFSLAIPVIKLFPFLTSPNTNNSFLYYSSDLSFLHCVQVLSSYLQPFGVHLEEETSRKVPSGTTVSSKDRAAYRCCPVQQSPATCGCRAPDRWLVWLKNCISVFIWNQNTNSRSYTQLVFIILDGSVLEGSHFPSLVSRAKCWQWHRHCFLCLFILQKLGLSIEMALIFLINAKVISF